MQLMRVMMIIARYGALISAAVSVGCSPAAPPEQSVPFLEFSDIQLPQRLHDSYLKSLDAVPELTAKRFLSAYENLAAYGPVTDEKIRDHARFQAATERSQFLSHIFAYDMNGDVKITRSEVEALARIPIRPHKALGERPLFTADKNGYDMISLYEATHYSRALYMGRTQGGLRPIESYLMLFDINTDGVVTRTEMMVSLKPYLGRKEAARGGGGAVLR